jgi:starvation-inducible DNA-binding protein
MTNTRVNLPQTARQALASLLNQHLAQAIDFALQSKQAHWNVKGPHFIALHELFDKIAEEAEDWVDDLAERAVSLGGTAEGTVGAVAQRTKLPAYPLTLQAGLSHVEALAGALAAFGNACRTAIDESNQHGDAATADLFTEIVRGADKYLWFLEAHLQAAG